MKENSTMKKMSPLLMTRVVRAAYLLRDWSCSSKWGRVEQDSTHAVRVGAEIEEGADPSNLHHYFVS
jgi:hypothetical protein